MSILSREGIEDTYITEGSVNGDIFWDFVQQQLLPILSPCDGHSPRSIIILDNASIHHVDPVVSAILFTGALLKFLPPYSPEFKSNELVFGEVNICKQTTWFFKVHFPQKLYTLLWPLIQLAKQIVTITQVTCSPHNHLFHCATLS